MYDIYAPDIILGSSSYTGAEFGNECWDDGKYTELIRIIHEVLGASVENYEPDMYDSITLNDTQVCKRHRDQGNRGTSLCMAFSDENG